jgi:hypothetical protein
MPASANRTHDSCSAQDSNKRNALQKELNLNILFTVCIAQEDCHMTWKPKLIFKNIPLILLS